MLCASREKASHRNRYAKNHYLCKKIKSEIDVSFEDTLLHYKVLVTDVMTKLVFAIS